MSRTGAMQAWRDLPSGQVMEYVTVTELTTCGQCGVSLLPGDAAMSPRGYPHIFVHYTYDESPPCAGHRARAGQQEDTNG